MGNLLQITGKSIQKGSMQTRGISQSADSYKIASSELKLTDAESQMLKHDLAEVHASFAQLGLMVVGLFPGWGEPADVSSAGIDFATGHPIAGTISLFCACPVAGWLGDIPLLGIRLYRITSSTFKCGKTMFVIAKTGNRAKKVFVWFGKRVIEASQESKTIKVIQKNIFDPASANTYKVFEELEKVIQRVFRDTKVRNYGHKLEYERLLPKK